METTLAPKMQASLCPSHARCTIQPLSFPDQAFPHQAPEHDPDLHVGKVDWSLLSDVFGVEHTAEYIDFEDQVHLDHTSLLVICFMAVLLSPGKMPE